MPHPTNELDIETDDFVDTIADGDYIFVMDCDGNLKSLLLPDDFAIQATPANIEKIMKIFGIAEIQRQSLH